VAEDGYLPRSFTHQGRRLVYSEGIWLLASLSGVLLLAFDGVTDRLIPLFAVGAFLAFTLSQWRMVGALVGRKQEARPRVPAWRSTGWGQLLPAVTVVVMAVVKFAAGAWVVVVLVPSLVVLMLAVGRHYRRIERETASPGNLKLGNLQEPIVIVPIIEWNSIAENAVRFAMTLSREVEVLHIESGDSTNSLKVIWPTRVEEPARDAKQSVPRLTVLKSPFRFVVQPIIDHVLEDRTEEPGSHHRGAAAGARRTQWYYYFLHNQLARVSRGSSADARDTPNRDRRRALVSA